MAYNTKSTAFVHIDFTETQQRHFEDEDEDEDKSHIGRISLGNYPEDEDDISLKDTEIAAIVSITLPIHMFSLLSMWEGKSIIFDTIHDIIKHPTRDQKTDGVIALVKRAYFQVMSDLP